MTLSCRDLSKSFKEQEILSNISITIDTGSIVALRGPSGCGKTTLLKCLSLLTDWNTGEIIVNGNKISHSASKIQKQRALHQQNAEIAVVFQQLYLWPHLSCKANIELTATKDFNLDEVATLATNPYINKYPHEISLGQAQRIAYIRAIASRPKYLLLDEVTSALDHDNTKIMAELINKQKIKGTGVMVITHSNEFEQLLDLDNKYEMNSGGIYGK